MSKVIKYNKGHIDSQWSDIIVINGEVHWFLFHFILDYFVLSKRQPSSIWHMNVDK